MKEGNNTGGITMHARSARTRLAVVCLLTIGSALAAGANEIAQPRAAIEPSRGVDEALHLADALMPGWSSTANLIARAERGIAISPVSLRTLPAHGPQRILVGLGSYVINAASDCAACHSGQAGYLSGGNPFFLDRDGHVVWTRNLTPDPETGLPLSLGQFLEAVRTGRDFHPGATRMLVVMPWTTLRWASAIDLTAVYAYLRSIPAVKNSVPPDSKDLPLPAAIPFPGDRYTDGVVDRHLGGEWTSFDAQRGREISPLGQPRPLGREHNAYGTGSYIANTFTHCNDCHTNPDRTADFSKVNTSAFLTGGTVFAVPPPLQSVFGQVRVMSQNVKGRANGFLQEPDDSYRRFREIVTSGTHADEPGRPPLGFPMNLVAANLKNLLDDDLFAVYTYVKRSPATRGETDQVRQPYARWCTPNAGCLPTETCAIAPGAGSGECVGGDCVAGTDCGACQTCEGGHCQAPAPDSECVASAQ